MLVEAKFLSRPGRFNETEFVKFWYNCHTIFNSYDLSKSSNPDSQIFLIKRRIFRTWNCIFSANNGHVTEQEFKTKVKELSGIKNESKIQESVHIIKIEKNMQKLYAKKFWNSKKTMFRTVDRDGDREISFIEFFTKLPELMTFISK